MVLFKVLRTDMGDIFISYKMMCTAKLKTWAGERFDDVIEARRKHNVLKSKRSRS